MENLRRYRYLIFGPSSFMSLPHRAQAIAIELASLGADVDYIEFPPSSIGELRNWLDQRVRRSAIERASGMDALPDTLTVHTPPRVLTSVRNSISPGYDRRKFRRWFGRRFERQEWENTVVWIMMPLWWKWFIDEGMIPAHLLIYDIADDLTVFSTSNYSLRRLHESERLLARHVELVTYSAEKMQDEIRERFGTTPIHFMPNAVSRHFIEIAAHGTTPFRGEPMIGFVGIVSDRWIDTMLLEKVAQRYTDYELVIVGPMDAGNAKRFGAHPNITLTGLLNHQQIAGLVAQFRVALIPFQKNAITRVVNPLKLYEYSSSGVPIVATFTEELSKFKELIYLAKSDEEFLDTIARAINEDNSNMREQRMHFARENTWLERLRAFDGILESFRN